MIASNSNWATRFAPYAAILAGAIWLPLWAHQMQSHGTTQNNERLLFLGLTWMDAGKFYVVPFLLLMVTIVGLERARTGAGRIGKPALFVLAAFACLAIGTALEFWGFPFGSYEVTFEEGMKDTWWLQLAGTFFLTAALLPFVIQHVRSGTLPVWMVPMLVFGALSTVYLTPAFFVPGIVWVLLGFVPLRQRR